MNTEFDSLDYFYYALDLLLTWLLIPLSNIKRIRWTTVSRITDK